VVVSQSSKSLSTAKPCKASLTHRHPKLTEIANRQFYKDLGPVAYGVTHRNSQ